jgi:hypothetical protein
MLIRISSNHSSFNTISQYHNIIKQIQSSLPHNTNSIKMQFLKLSALVLPLLAGVMAAPAPEAAAAPAPWREEAAPGQETYPEPPQGAPSAPIAARSVDKRGFGCPFNAYECSDHVSHLSKHYRECGLTRYTVPRSWRWTFGRLLWWPMVSWSPVSGPCQMAT